MISRRGMLGGLLIGLAAPAIIRTPGLLMRVKPALSNIERCMRKYAPFNPPVAALVDTVSLDMAAEMEALLLHGWYIRNNEAGRTLPS